MAADQNELAERLLDEMAVSGDGMTEDGSPMTVLDLLDALACAGLQLGEGDAASHAYPLATEVALSQLLLTDDEASYLDRQLTFLGRNATEGSTPHTIRAKLAAESKATPH